ncbi:hypothetical protein [Avibacterium paragallinarum]|uniref:Uncharacterized protein n=1 Tax=Avibacterium paragallinarum TaxID=728 RepID=A0ABU7QSM4_AVIPA|nr:hypothetical protein [Avibacterium paragallinarum]
MIANYLSDFAVKQGAELGLIFSKLPLNHCHFKNKNLRFNALMVSNFFGVDQSAVVFTAFFIKVEKLPAIFSGEILTVCHIL